MLDGKILACRLVKLACQRYFDDIRDSKVKGFHHDPVVAQRVIDFFPTFLRFYDGAFAGQPFILQPWQQFLTWNIFGWLDSNNHRRFRTVFCETGKGSGKTPYIAGLGLYGLTLDHESGSEIYSAAVTKEQAGIMFRDAKVFAEQSPSMSKRLIIDKHNIAYPDTNSFFRPISSEHRGLDGKRPHMALVDEIHEHPSDIVVNKMSLGMKGRVQPLTIEITNALDVCTLIPTPDDWKMMQDIVVGDRVFDENGNICNVIATSPIMRGHACYQLTFDDGSKVIADEGHYWETTLTRSKSVKWQTAIRPTKEIHDTLYYYYGNNKQLANHRVRIAGPIDTPHADLPIDPYVLGLWIGDGNSKDSGLAVPEEDIEILDYVEAAGYNVGDRRSLKSTGTKLRLHGVGIRNDRNKDHETLSYALRNLGLIGNKHIPTPYLRASIPQRLSLLQGLMDTDGCVTQSGRCIFTQSKYHIILQVAELIQSLGIKCFVRNATITTSFGKRLAKEYLRWDISFTTTTPVFRLSRKLQRMPKTFNSAIPANRYIVNSELVTTVPVKCIEVDSESKLFLAGMSFIPTHNSGYDRQSVCWNHHEYSEKVLSRIIDDETWFAYITGLEPCDKCRSSGASAPVDGCPDCDDWRDETKWIKANPNLSVSIQPSYIRKQVEEAKNIPSKQNIVKRLNMGIWTQAVTRWLSIDEWNMCDGDVNVDYLVGKPCYGGLDLSSNTDTTSLVWVFPPYNDDDIYRILCRFFIPEDNMRQRVVRDRVPYDVWVREGYITATPGNIIDYAFILKTIEDDCQRFDVRELAFDRWGSQKITTDLQDMGFEIKGENSKAESSGRLLVQFGQGFASMNSPAKELEKLVVAHQLAHGGNPVLTWMASNVVIQTDPAGNIKPAKDKSTERIDGVVSLLMGLDRAMRNSDSGESIYETQGAYLL